MKYFPSAKRGIFYPASVYPLTGLFKKSLTNCNDFFVTSKNWLDFVGDTVYVT